MAAHTKEQREFIVRRLGAFYTPRDICAAFMARWPDTKCSEADVAATDPRLVILDPDLHAAFNAARADIVEDPNAAPSAQQSVRLILLHRMVERYLDNNQPAEARAVMRQIAEEQGVVSGKGGGKAAATPGDDAPIVSITRTVVYPKVAE